MISFHVNPSDGHRVEKVDMVKNALISHAVNILFEKI